VKFEIGAAFYVHSPLLTDVMIFLNFFAEKFSEKIGVFWLSKQS
jgi:hypothetical protein